MSENIKPKFRVGIIGHNEAIDIAFNKYTNEVFVVDNMQYHIEDLFEWQPNITFVCDDVLNNDFASFTDTILRVLNNTSGAIIIKTILPRDQVKRICKLDKKIVYNPDVFVDYYDGVLKLLEPEFMIIGGTPDACGAMSNIYRNLSTYKVKHIFQLSPEAASLAHESVHMLETMKSLFYNKLYDISCENDVDYEQIARVLEFNNGHIGTRIFDQNNQKGTLNTNTIKCTKMLQDSINLFTIE